MGTEFLEHTGISLPNFPRLRPVNNITPFTYQDGSTFLEILVAMERYIKQELVPSVDKEMGEFVVRLNNFIADLESGLTLDREQMNKIYGEFTDRVAAEVALINNKTGAVDVQHVNLTSAATKITINPLWPNNQPVEFRLVQDATGGRAPSWDTKIKSTPAIDTAPRAVTRFTLHPDGTGNWYAVQNPDSLAELNSKISAAIQKPLSDMRGEIADANTANTKLINDFKTATNTSLGEFSAKVDKTNETIKDNGFVFANFVANGPVGEHLNLFYSPDGKTLYGGKGNPAYVPADGNGLRDPSIIYRNERWYVCYTTKDGQNKDFAIASSSTGHPGSWSLLTKVSAASVSGLVKAWAPEFVVDGNDVYVFFTKINSANTGSMQYVKATNAALTSWSAPSPVTWTDEPASYIDGVPVKGTDNKWYLFYSVGNSIDRAVSTKITGPWTVDKTGNWAGWGTGIEGPNMVKDGSVYRMYFDRYVTNQGLHWSEATSLNGPWSSPLKVVTAPYVLRSGQTLRHGGVYKLENPMERNKIQAALMMPKTSGNHSEWQNPPGIPVSNQVRTVMRWVVPDDNEMVNPDLVSFEDGGTFTLNEYGVYAISMTAGAQGVTGVNRSFIELTDETGRTIHMRQSSGPEDTMGFSIANFKPRAAGEKFRFYLYIRWTGTEPTAAVPIRVRITKVADA